MLIGLHPLTLQAFDNFVITKKIERLELKNTIINEIKIDEALLQYLTSQEEWGYDTVLLATFNNTLEAGNITNNGMTIAQLKIKKKKSTDMQWQDLKIFDFDKDVTEYNYTDKLVESLEDYDYAIQPVGEGGALGKETIKSVECEFENTWLVGVDEQYELAYNLEWGDIETVQKMSLVETIGGKYPIINKNGNLNYRRTNVKAMLVADNTIDYGQIDRKAEKKLRKDIMNFLMDGKIKILKSGSGIYMAVIVKDTPKLIPNNNLNQYIFEVGFEVVEIGDVYDNKFLKQNGFLEL